MAALATWGAITGTVAVATQLLVFLRDRPKLAVGLGCGQEMGQPAMLSISVANRGRQPTTLVKAAFIAAAGTYSVTMEDGVEHPMPRPEIDMAKGQLRLIEPGGMTVYAGALEVWPPGFPADTPLRAYVVDSHGRRTWGGVGPMFRMLLNSGWEPPAGTDPAVARPPDNMQPELPEAVYPRWQVWRPKHLRNPELPPPHAWPRADRPTGIKSTSEVLLAAQVADAPTSTESP